jgi:CHAT domain-containing protein
MLAFPYLDQSGQDARLLARKGDFSLAHGDVPGALALFERARAFAGRTGDATSERRILNDVGACELALFKYDAAAATLLKLRESSKRARDYPVLAGSNANLAALFTQTDNLAAAEFYARESLEAYSHAHSPLSYYPQLSLANILSRRPMSERQILDPQSEKYFRDVIEAATRDGEWRAVSEGWLYYGRRLMEADRFAEADHAFAKSLSLRQKRHLRAEEDCLLEMSRLRLKEHRIREALSLADLAVNSTSNDRSRVPFWMLLEARAKALLALGAEQEALKQSRMAIALARASRANVVPDDNERIGAENYFERAYSTLIDAGNRLYLRSGNTALIQETFEAVEENRAQTLEALLPAVQNWRSRLPEPAYHNTLAALVRVQSRLFLASPGPEVKRRYSELQIRLSEMERQAGLPSAQVPGSVFERVRGHLPPGSALLTFHLGDDASWLWALDAHGLHLRQLPPRAEIEAKIRGFQNAISENQSATIEHRGRSLYRELFGGPNESYANATKWFLSIGEQLYNLSFPALVPELRDGHPVYLAQQRSLQIIPGAKLFRIPNNQEVRPAGFVFAGDGIYNRADPRLQVPPLVRPAAWSMPRLHGSREELDFAAGLWPRAVLLTGKSLSRTALLASIDQDPEVIHIASHVLEGHNRWRSAVLALGMNRAGEPDLLTPEEIVLHPVHSRLVVMTGCASGTAQSVPVSGLMGLTRAWLAAGAHAVLATSSPTRDEAADGLIGRFYIHLMSSSAGNVGDSLRRAREDMIARGGWRAEPRYWASFFLIGGR